MIGKAELIVRKLHTVKHKEKHEACVQYMELVINTIFNMVLMLIKYLPSGGKTQW